MDDRPPSRTSTVRPGDSRTPASAAERENFLSLALARLSLSRPATPRAPLEPVPSATEQDSTLPPPTMQTLGSATSRPSAEQEEEGEEAGTRSHRRGSGGGDTFFTLSGSRTSLTDGTLSRDETSSLAHEVVFAFLTDSVQDSYDLAEFRSDRLLFYRALLIQFGICKPKNLPNTIEGCRKLLRQIHICLKEYLKVVERGGDVGAEVQRARPLPSFRPRPPCRTIPLDRAKSELLQPFLIEVA
ncbi:hypothetical protein JCM8547_006805 [Rhodosporidiobolus lusitaniae]